MIQINASAEVSDTGLLTTEDDDLIPTEDSEFLALE